LLNRGKTAHQKAHNLQSSGYEFASSISAAHLYKIMSTTELSGLQKKLLRAGLMVHYREAADTVFGARDPGCFAINAMMKEIDDRQVRASRRGSMVLWDPQRANTRPTMVV
jgi:hypothetical protein